MQVVGRTEFRAYDELESAFLRLLVSSNHARHRTFICDRERAVSELMSLRHEFLRMRSAAQKGEVGDAMQFRIIHL